MFRRVDHVLVLVHRRLRRAGRARGVEPKAGELRGRRRDRTVRRRGSEQLVEPTPALAGAVDGDAVLDRYAGLRERRHDSRRWCRQRPARPWPWNPPAYRRSRQHAGRCWSGSRPPRSAPRRGSRNRKPDRPSRTASPGRPACTPSERSTFAMRHTPACSSRKGQRPGPPSRYRLVATPLFCRWRSTKGPQILNVSETRSAPA